MNKKREEYIKKRLHDELTEKFIVYQHRLDNPMPTTNETMERLILKYQNDPFFHNKVSCLVNGVMCTVEKYL